MNQHRETSQGTTVAERFMETDKKWLGPGLAISNPYLHLKKNGAIQEARMSAEWWLLGVWRSESGGEHETQEEPPLESEGSTKVCC